MQFNNVVDPVAAFTEDPAPLTAAVSTFCDEESLISLRPV